MHAQEEHLSPDMLLTYPISQSYPLAVDSGIRLRCDSPNLNVTLDFMDMFKFTKPTDQLMIISSNRHDRFTYKIINNQFTIRGNLNGYPSTGMGFSQIFDTLKDSTYLI